MNKGLYKITENRPLTADVYLMKLAGETAELVRPGQFVNIALNGYYLRRPISVCDYDQKSITILYKVVGAGTEQMSLMTEGEELDLLVGLGNGFDTAKSGAAPLLIGGGAGVPPMYKLAKELIAEGGIAKGGKEVRVILGFNTAQEIFYAEEFKKAGAQVFISTVDGSVGTKGFVTDVIKELGSYSHYYACGPMPMLKAVYDTCNTEGQLSFEERMGCGFGACMGCSCKTRYGNKRICKEGPVLSSEEVIW